MCFKICNSYSRFEMSGPKISALVVITKCFRCLSVRCKSNKKRLENDQIKKTARGGGNETKHSHQMFCFIKARFDG